MPPGRGLVRLLLAAGLAGWLGGCSAGGPESCKVHRVVDLPLLSGGRLPAIEASLDRQKVVFYIDTGAVTSLITTQGARRFALRGNSETRTMPLLGIGGMVRAPVVTLHSLVLGHGLARNIDLPVAGDFGGPVQGMPVIGLFGADFLSSYDVDIDLPGHHFAVYDLRGCAGVRLRPLDPPAFEMPFHLDETKVVLDLKLNDKPMVAFLDSGATRTLVTRADARRSGVTMEAMTGDRSVHAVGIDANPMETRIHRFGSLEVGDEQIRNFPLAVGNIDVSLLGDDFLRFNRVWISYPRQLLFIRPMLR